MALESDDCRPGPKGNNGHGVAAEGSQLVACVGGKSEIEIKDLSDGRSSPSSSSGFLHDSVVDDESAESTFVSEKGRQKSRTSVAKRLSLSTQPKKRGVTNGDDEKNGDEAETSSSDAAADCGAGIDISALKISMEEETQFESGRAILNFKCKRKSGVFGILKGTTVQLDLGEMCMRKLKSDPRAVVVAVKMEAIVKTSICNGNEVDIKYVGGDSSGDGADSSVHGRRFVFDGSTEAHNFMAHLNVMMTSGNKLKQIFGEIDKRGVGQISLSSLARAMRDSGLCKEGKAATEEAKQMISLADSDSSSGIDFVEFFRLFMFTPCATVHQALREWRNKVALTQKRRAGKQKVAASKQSDSHLSTDWLLGGEVIVNVIDNMRYSFGVKAKDNLDGNHHNWVGVLTLTNYRLVLQSYFKHERTAGFRHEISDYFDRIDIPTNTIQSMSKLDSSCLLIVCKDLRKMLLSFERNDIWLATLMASIQSIALPYEGGGGPKSTFAFALTSFSNKASAEANNGWKLYDPHKEFERIGVLNSPHARFYRIWSDHYTLCETYPKHLCLPSAMSESEIIQAAKFRSKCRIPAVSWRNKKNGAVLCRSAQPMVGLKSSRNAADEKLLNLYRVRGDPESPLEMEDPSTMYILDARNILAATGNQVQGKGTEIVGNYAHTELAYLNIDNIHVMRDSASTLGSGGVSQDHLELKDGFLQHLKDSMWLRHVQFVLKGCVLAAERLELNESSVLVHCSDGWDRTSQLSSITMLLVDPYYRSIKGFAVLVEKEWCSFGHKFSDRHGQASQRKRDERSPVFLQFLDIVHQIMLQFPCAFEMNERMLVFLADMVHSCLFGTFLGNNEKEREVSMKVKSETISVWTYILAKKKLYVNPHYDKRSAEVLWPSTSIKCMKLWERYFCRFDYEAHPRAKGCSSGRKKKWVDDWGTTTKK